MQNEPQTREAADFNGRRILVTGGTKGIGEAIVERLMRGGGKVITTARSLPPGGTRDRFVQADVSTRAGIDQVVKAMMDRLGGLDILIHNVGGSAAPGGGIRHGLDLNEGLLIGPHEARLFCNLIRSYVSYLLGEHERLQGLRPEA